MHLSIFQTWNSGSLLLGLGPEEVYISPAFLSSFFSDTNCAIFTVTVCETVRHVVYLILRVLFFQKTLLLVLLEISGDLLTLYNRWSVWRLTTVFVNMLGIRTSENAKHSRHTLKYDNLKRTRKYALFILQREALFKGIQETNATVHRKTYICPPSTSLLLSLTTTLQNPKILPRQKFLF